VASAVPPNVVKLPVVPAGSAIVPVNAGLLAFALVLREVVVAVASAFPSKRVASAVPPNVV
jgi:hypothetical protein